MGNFFDLYKKGAGNFAGYLKKGTEAGNIDRRAGMMDSFGCAELGAPPSRLRPVPICGTREFFRHL